LTEAGFGPSLVFRMKDQTFKSYETGAPRINRRITSEIVLTLGLLAGSTVGYSQGTINWSDYVSPDQSTGSPGFSISVFGPGYRTQGTGPYPNNTSMDLPPGTATYTGAPLSGSGNTIALYVDTTSFAVQNDVYDEAPVALDSFGTGDEAGTWDLTGSLVATVPGINAGTAVFVELAAWEGNYTSFASAGVHGAPLALSGVSTGTTILGGPSGDAPPAFPGNLEGIGLQSFGIFLIPEPSPIVLGILAGLAFLMRFGRKPPLMKCICNYTKLW